MKKILITIVATLTILPMLAFAQTGSAASSCISITHNIQYGSRDAFTGGDVSTLQNFLQKQGYLTSSPTGYFGTMTVAAVNKFQRANGISAVGSVGPLTRVKINSTSCLNTTVLPILPTPITYPTTPACLNGAGPLLPGQKYCSTPITPTPTPTQNLNTGTIAIRAIVANIDEVGNNYGSYGMKFAQSKLSEVDSALQRLNTFVQQSSYGKAKLSWQTSGVYELGSGVCNHTAYGDKVNDLIQRALQAADSQTPFSDYSYYIIVHPMPNCSDGVTWTFEGKGQFTAYTLNGRTVHLRGIHISDLSDQYLFHEFGHTLAYQANTNIGHPDYLNCPATISGSETKIALSSTCPHVFDFNSGATPIFTMMSTPSILSDYSSVEKEVAGWLTGSDVVTTTAGQYNLSPIEQTGSAPKALKIPISGTNFTVYVSFREPAGYTYPATSGTKPNGVILDITNNTLESFLVTNNANMNKPLQIGTPYRLGTNGPVVRVNSISNNIASITVSSGSTILPPIVPPVIPPVVPPCLNGAGPLLPGQTYCVTPVTQTPSCTLTSNKTSYNYGETITFSWTSKNSAYATWQQDTSGKDHLNLSSDKLSANGSQSVTASVIGSPTVTLLVAGLNSGTGFGSCSKTVSIVSSTPTPTPTPITTETASIDQASLKVLPSTSFTLTGGTSAKSGSFIVAIVGPNYSGSTDWNTIGNLLKGGSYTAMSRTVSLYGAGWTASFGGLLEGYYTALIYDSSYNLLTTGTLWVTAKG